MALVVHVAHHRQTAHNGYARSVTRHQKHALLTVAIRAVRVGLAHDDKDFTAWARGPGNPPLAPIEYIFVALMCNRVLNIRGIGTGNRRFGHGKGRTDLAVE